MHQFNTFVRHPSEDVKSGRVGLAHLMGDVPAIGLTISPAMEYNRSMSDFPLNDSQRLSVIAEVGRLGNPQLPIKLKAISSLLLYRRAARVIF